MTNNSIYVGRPRDGDVLVHTKYIKKVMGKNGKWKYIYDKNEIKNGVRKHAERVVNRYVPGYGKVAVNMAEKGIAKQYKRYKEVSSKGKGDYASIKYGTPTSKAKKQVSPKSKSNYASNKYGKPVKSLEQRRKEISEKSAGARNKQRTREKAVHEKLQSTTEAAKRARSNAVERAKMSANKTSRKLGIAQRRELKTAKINQQSNDTQLQYRKVGDQGYYRDSRGRTVMAKDGNHTATTTLVSKKQSQSRVDAAQRQYDKTTLGRAEKRIRSIGKRKRKSS